MPKEQKGITWIKRIVIISILSAVAVTLSHVPQAPSTFWTISAATTW